MTQNGGLHVRDLAASSCKCSCFSLICNPSFKPSYRKLPCDGLVGYREANRIYMNIISHCSHTYFYKTRSYSSTLKHFLHTCPNRETNILLGGARQSPQYALSRPNRTGPRGTVQKRTRPTFERQSSQFLCLYDCPSRFVARTSRSLDLKARFRGVSYDS